MKFRGYNLFSYFLLFVVLSWMFLIPLTPTNAIYDAGATVLFYAPQGSNYKVGCKGMADCQKWFSFSCINIDPQTKKGDCKLNYLNGKGSVVQSDEVLLAMASGFCYDDYDCGMIHCNFGVMDMNKYAQTCIAGFYSQKEKDDRQVDIKKIAEGTVDTPTNDFSSEPKDPILFTPQLTIPGSEFVQNSSTALARDTSPIAKYIKAIFAYALTIVGILATAMLMIGGIVWLTAGGNTSKVSQAKSFISSSLIGVFLLFTSYILLSAINPDLVNLKIRKVTYVAEIPVGGKCIIGGAEGQYDENGECRPYTSGADCQSDEGLSGFRSATSGACKTCVAYSSDTTSAYYKNGSNTYCSQDYECANADLNETNNPSYKCGPSAGGVCDKSTHTCKSGSATTNNCVGKDDGVSCITSAPKYGYCLNEICQPCIAYGKPCQNNYQCPSQHSNNTYQYNAVLGYKCGSDSAAHNDQDCANYNHSIGSSYNVCDCEADFCKVECQQNIAPAVQSGLAGEHCP